MFTAVRLLTLVGLVVAGFGLASCETMYGAGRDLEKAGTAIQGAAK